MTDKNMDIGTPSISAIEKPRESTLSAPVRDDCLDRLLQANEERKRKVDQLAIELSALKVDHRRNASRERCQSRERSPSRRTLYLRAGLIGYTPGDNKAIGIVRLVAVDTTAGYKKAPPDLPAFAVRQRCTLHT
ncbi:hypothetical protein MRX96_017237 [Rhipicephalus microplus]